MRNIDLATFLVLACLALRTEAALGKYINEYFMFTSTQFTNNGGAENSTCDLKIDLTYDAEITAANNYAAFAII